MFEISNNSLNIHCQSCGEKAKLFSITVMNKHKQGTEIHLCKDCCKTLHDLLCMTQLTGVKYCSIEELDK